MQSTTKALFIGIVTERADFVKEDMMTEFLEQTKNISEWILCQQEIQKVFPKHSRAAHSLACRTKETGVMLCPEARRIEMRVKGKHEKRVKVNRFGCRLTDEVAQAVKTKMQMEGIQSIQTLLETLLKGWVTA